MSDMERCETCFYWDCKYDPLCAYMLITGRRREKDSNGECLSYLQTKRKKQHKTRVYKSNSGRRYIHKDKRGYFVTQIKSKHYVKHFHSMDDAIKDRNAALLRFNMAIPD